MIICIRYEIYKKINEVSFLFLVLESEIIVGGLLEMKRAKIGY
ncbi:hypothetical protein CLPUN_28300 [Clostridium puniceum]|uniref:Uncharacterized protein n=1 Tax=Clostridium puniceum TaxID=29367 RepID=A0A1S8TEH0_9CLOT|nr:hypothetical protein CLPUN_28300 [Clostridium puniceum]